jgi:2,4-dienoyl-CoA reductase (NADPH2)
MGSEGYLINQFIAQQTNFRDDQLGRQLREPHPLRGRDGARVHAATGPNFIIIFRLSMLDLVEGGSTWDEIVQLAKAIEPPARRSSTPASAGTRRASRPSPRWSRAPPSPG